MLTEMYKERNLQSGDSSGMLTDVIASFVEADKRYLQSSWPHCKQA